MWTAIDRLLIIWKSDLSDKIKGNFFQAKFVTYPKYEYVKYSYGEKSRNTDNSHCSGTKRWFTSWLLVFRQKGRETQFLLCWLFLHRPSVNPHLDCPAQSQNLNSKMTKIPSPSLLGLMSFTPQSHFLFGVFIMTFVIVISSAREHELYSMCAPAPVLSQIVQSPTKPNDKI